MTSWQERPRAAFDLETTGRDPREARIVTASILLVDSNGSTLEHHEWLADPGLPIPEEAAAIHGVSTEYARRHGQPAAEVVREVAAVLTRLFDDGVPVLAFNARYDFTVLEREGERHGVSTPTPRPVLDPLILDKQVDRYRRGKRTLTAMCAHYGIEFENAHTSAADVAATLRVAAALAQRFQLLDSPAEELHDRQLVWAERQAANFQEYVRRTNPVAVIECAWPVLPAGAPDAAETPHETEPPAATDAAQALLEA